MMFNRRNTQQHSLVEAIRPIETDVNRHGATVTDSSKFLITQSLNHLITSQAVAFTLAEVLITLAIIGIVAAITIPGIVHKYKKTEVETKLKRFYAMSNQAIQLSEIENGPKESWVFQGGEGCSTGYEERCLRAFWEKYLEKYIKYNKVEYINAGDAYGLLIYFADGSAVRLAFAGHDYVFQTDVKHTKTEDLNWGKNAFLFGLYPTNSSPYFTGRGIVPYVNVECRTTMDLTKDKECLYNYKENYARIIQLNNWTIPDDYPIKL